MQNIFKQIFTTIVVLIIIFYATAIRLSYANSTPQQDEIIKALTNTANNGAEKIFQLISVDLLHFN
jgi:preprotein translocase subunit SecG